MSFIRFNHTKLKDMHFNRYTTLIKTVMILFLVSTNLWAQDGISPPTPQPKIDAKSMLEVEQVNDDKVKKPTSPPSPVQAPQVSMECNPKPIAVAQALTCTVTITHSTQLTVKVQAAKGAESGEAILPKKMANGELETIRTFTMRSLDLNKPVRIKGVRVTWDAIGGEHGEIKVPNQKIPIKSVIMGVSNPQVRTFKNPLGLDGEQKPEKIQKARVQFWARHAPIPLEEFNWPLVIILGLIGMAFAGLFIGWIIGQYVEARRRARAPVVDLRPAHVIAWSDLEELKDQEWISQKEFKLYYQRLSEIIRSYVGKRYHLSVGIEMTSDEVRANVRSMKIDADSLLCVEDFLSDTDLVKFADASPSMQSVESITQLAYRVIDLTKVADDAVSSDSTDGTSSNTSSTQNSTASQEKSL
jgi:hypothetical protein